MRQNWLDIAKALGIIAVVLGHSGNETAHHYLFWFHMPLFFIISGFLFKPIAMENGLSWIVKRSKQLLLPYFAFAITISLVFWLVDGFPSMKDMVIQAARLVYSGNILAGPFTVFWFIPCFFLTQAVFALITMVTRDKRAQIAIVLALFIVGHLVSIPFSLPWNADAILLTLFYYAAGYYGRMIKYPGTTGLAAFSLLAPLVILILEWFGVFSYTLDLKYKVHGNILLDAIIPVFFSVTVLFLGRVMEKLNVNISAIGVHSLTIMYLHVPVNMLLQHVFQYGPYIFTLIGVLVPFGIAMILHRFRFSKRAFLGITSNSASA